MLILRKIILPFTLMVKFLIKIIKKTIQGRSKEFKRMDNLYKRIYKLEYKVLMKLDIRLFFLIKISLRFRIFHNGVKRFLTLHSISHLFKTYLKRSLISNIFNRSMMKFTYNFYSLITQKFQLKL
jgi:hypothetical protein